MKNQDLEYWVLSVIDRVKSGQPNEDSRVELKRDWPEDHSRAARRIAGHANASHGDPVLWIIGVDGDAQSVVGAEHIEMAEWWPQVQAEFEDHFAPELQKDLVVLDDSLSVVALLFESDRAPYVVRNRGDGPIDREVTWREGTSIRTAKRSDLIKILVPVTKLPEIDVLIAEFEYQDHEISPWWRFRADLYVKPRNDEGSITMPKHLTAVIAHWSEETWGETNIMWFKSWEGLSDNVIADQSQLCFNGPGSFRIIASCDYDAKQINSKPELTVRLTFGVIEADSRPVRIEIPLLIDSSDPYVINRVLDPTRRIHPSY